LSLASYTVTTGGADINAEELKALQAPLKRQYKEQPDSALITLRTKGRRGEGDGITCKVETGKAILQAGLHPATGGDGLSLCSGDMLLEALVACAGVTMKAVATAIGVDIQDAVITAEGDLDFRGTLAVAKDAPVGFKNIRLHFDIKSSAGTEQFDLLIKLTERYCVVYQSLARPPEMTVAYHVQ
jgi:uncharacterized OsmC-like protein